MVDRTQVEFDLNLQGQGAEQTLKRLEVLLKNLEKLAKSVNAALNLEGGKQAANAQRQIAGGGGIIPFLNAEAAGDRNLQKGLQQHFVNKIKSMSVSQISEEIATASKDKLAALDQALRSRLAQMTHNFEFARDRSATTGKPIVDAAELARYKEIQSLQQKALARSTQLAEQDQRAKKAAAAAEREYNKEVRTGIKLQSEARIAEQRRNDIAIQQARINTAKADVDKQRELAAQGRKNTLESSETDLVREQKRLETLQAFQKVRAALDRDEVAAAKSEANAAASRERSHAKNLTDAQSNLRIQQQIGTAYDKANAQLKLLNAELTRNRALQAAGKPNDLTTIERSYARQIQLVQQLKKEQQQADAVNNRRQMQERDGGAGLFGFQVSLLKNYMLMSQFFNLISFGTRFVVELDEAFRQLQAISGTTATSMERLKVSLMDTSMMTKFTAVEVAQASVLMAQAGFSTQQIEKSIGAITLFSTAVGEDLTKSVDLVTSTMSIFNLRAEEMGFVSDFMVGALNRSKLTVDKLTYGLQYAGNTAHEAGIGFTELTTVLAAFANAGIRSGSTLGTGLRQLIVDLIDPSEKMVASLRSVGLTLEDVNVRSRGLISVLKTMREAGFSTSHAFSSMEVRSAAAYAAISRQAGGLHALERSMMLSTAAAEANEVQIQSISNTMSRFAGVGGLFINEITTPLQKLFTSLVSGAIDLFSWLNKLSGVVRLFGSALLTLGLASVTVSVTRLIANFAFLNTNLKATVAAAKGATTALGGLAAASRTLNFTTWIGIAVGAGVALADMMGLFDTTADKIDKAKSQLENSQGAWDEHQSNLQAVGDKISELNSKYDELNGDSEALETATTEIRIRFRDMGLELPAVISNVDDLTSALGALRNRLNELSTLRLTAVISDLNHLIQVMGGSASDDALNIAGSPLWNYVNPGEAVTSTVREAAAQAAQLKAMTSSGPMDAEQIAAAKELSITLYKTYQRAIDELDRYIAGNPGRAGAFKSTREAFVKGRDDQLGFQAALVDRGIAGDNMSREQYEKWGTAGVVAREAEARRRYSESPVDKDMNAQERTAARTERKRQLEQEREALEHEVLLLKAQGREKEAFYLESSQAYIGYHSFLSDELRKVQTSVDADKKLLGEVERDTSETLRSKEQRLTEARRATTQGSAEWRGLGDQIVDIIREQAEFELDGMRKELAETTDSGRKVSLQGKIDERSARLDADIERVWDMKEERGGSLAGAVSDAKNALVDTIQSWRDALQGAKDNRDDAIKRAQDALKFFDEEVENAERTGKYSSFDITYAKRETRKGVELTSLRDQAEASRAFVNGISGDAAATQAALEDQIKYYDVQRKSAKTDQERISASKDYTTAMGQLRAIRGELNDAEREALSIEGRLAAAMGVSSVSVINLSDAMRTSIKWYLEDNGGNLDMVDYFKTNLPNAVSGAGSALSKFFKDTATGSVSVADGFKAMAASIIESLLDIAAQYAAMQIFQGIMGLLGVGAPTSLGGGATSAGMGLASGGGSSIPSWISGMRNGGGPTMAATGRLVGGQGARDTQLFGLTPGEYVLRKSAVDAVGVDTLDRINALGNRTISGGAASMMSASRPVEPDVTNIYVMPPNEKPTLTKKDVLINMQDFLQTDGTTKQLVRQISRGVG